MTLNRYLAGTVVQLNAEFTNNATLSVALQMGTGYVALPVAPLSVAIATNDVLTIGNGPSRQTVIASAPAIVTATSISVNSFVANDNFPISSVVNYLIDPATVQFKWQPGFRAAVPATLTYVPAGSGLAVIIKVVKGVYYVQLDTTGSLSTQWTYEWFAPVGIGQAIGDGVFDIVAAPL